MAGLTDLCASSLLSAGIACEVGNLINEFVANATASEAALDNALTDLTIAYDNNISQIDYQAVSPSLTAGVSTAFVAPTETPARGDYSSLQPTEVTLPARAGLLDSTAWDTIFTRARSRIARATAAKYRNDINETGALGFGISSPALTAATREATQAQTDGVAMAALEQAAQESTAERDDIRLILGLEIQNFTAKWDVIRTRLAAEEEAFRSKIQNYLAQVQREAERRGWSQMEINSILQQAKDNAESAIAWGRITLDKLMQAEEVIIRMKAAVFQTWLQAADLGLNSSSNFSSAYQATEAI